MRTHGSQNRDTPERRRAILQAALNVFHDVGYERATLDRIAVSIGITKGSVYHHFASKEAIAVTLYAAAVDEIHSAVATALSTPSDAQQVVEGMVRAYLHWFEQNPILGSFVFAVMDGRIVNVQVGDVLTFKRDFIDATSRWLTKHLRGRVRRMPVSLRTALVLGPARDFLRGWFETRDAKQMRAAKLLLPGAVWRSIALE